MGDETDAMDVWEMSQEGAEGFDADREAQKLMVKRAKAKRKRLARQMREREARDPNLRLVNRTSHTGNQQ